jgi:hypothetical protein
MIDVILDSLDSVSQELRPVYTEHEGKFILDPDKYAEHQKKPLLDKNKQLITELRSAQGQAKRFESLKDLDDDQLGQLLETHNSNGDTKAKSDEGTTKLTKKHADEKKKLQDQIDSLTKEVKHYKLILPLKDIALEAGIFPDSVDLVIYDTGKYFRLDDNGKIVVLDEDGDPTDVTPQKFFSDVYKERRPRFYAPSNAGGSGARPDNYTAPRGQKSIKRTEWEKMSAKESSAFFKAGGKVVD